jgi:ribosomal protein S18 acetylase RimI-like enzyme
VSDLLHIQRLDAARHDREGFDCGVAELNGYLARQANQDVKKSACGCWVAVSSEGGSEVLGYYTLSAEAVEVSELPELPRSLGRKLPRYRRIGAALLGRLAVAKTAQGRRIGERLLYDALTRCLVSEIPFVVVLVDPKDGRAAEWYRRFGFRSMSGNRMVVTMNELRAYFAG